MGRTAATTQLNRIHLDRFVIFPSVVCTASVSGGAYNPARYLAPAIWSWSLDAWLFAYVLGELLGGCAAALMRHAFDVLGRMAHVQEDKAAELRKRTVV